MLLASPRRLLTAVLAALTLIAALPSPAQAAADLAWTSRSVPLEQEWISVAYGNGTYVAVADSLVSGNKVMTSPDGITWTARASADDTAGWRSIAFGAGLFVAVAWTGTGQRIMTSPDGITWTGRASGDDLNKWNAVTYANGKFVAVATSSGRAPSPAPTALTATSADGITWTVGTDSDTLNKNWYGLTYGNGVFVATGGANAVMTSPDGLDWTTVSNAASLPADTSWRGTTYANGLFVAVASNGTAQRIMTSPNGTTWTARTSPDDTTSWYDVEYGAGQFVAVARDSVNNTNRVMTSPDGMTWSSQAAAPNTNRWQGITYANGQFVAVASTGFPTQVMTGVPAVSSVPWTLVRQALPMPAMASCVDVQDASYAWGTGLRGGWQRGWERWVVNSDGSRGGWACLRVLVNRGGNEWVIDNSVA